MRHKVLATTAAVVLAFGMNSLPAVAKSGGWSGGKGGGGFGKSGGFSKWGGHHGKGHHFGKGGFKHAHGFKHRHGFRNQDWIFWGGWWPGYYDTPTNLIVRYQEPVAPPPPPVVVAQPKVLSAGTPGGCNVEHVNVAQGTVNVYRC
jgi:hypothetical protein